MAQVSIPEADAGNAGLNRDAVATEGDCLHPEYQHGDIVIRDPDQKPEAGDFVVI